jgi:hypothetical protein
LLTKSVAYLETLETCECTCTCIHHIQYFLILSGRRVSVRRTGWSPHVDTFAFLTGDYLTGGTGLEVVARRRTGDAGGYAGAYGKARRGARRAPNTCESTLAGRFNTGIRSGCGGHLAWIRTVSRVAGCWVWVWVMCTPS